MQPGFFLSPLPPLLRSFLLSRRRLLLLSCTYSARKDRAKERWNGIFESLAQFAQPGVELVQAYQLCVPPLDRRATASRRLATWLHLRVLSAELKLNVNFFGGESASELNVSGRTDLKHQEFYIEGTYEMLA